eukprot:2964119-Rhodomonas_salina.1
MSPAWSEAAAVLARGPSRLKEPGRQALRRDQIDAGRQEEGGAAVRQWIVAEPVGTEVGRRPVLARWEQRGVKSGREPGEPVLNCNSPCIE